jgi:hypothetical protein
MMHGAGEARLRWIDTISLRDDSLPQREHRRGPARYPIYQNTAPRNCRPSRRPCRMAGPALWRQRSVDRRQLGPVEMVRRRRPCLHRGARGVQGVRLAHRRPAVTLERFPMRLNHVAHLSAADCRYLRQCDAYRQSTPCSPVSKQVLPCRPTVHRRNRGSRQATLVPCTRPIGPPSLATPDVVCVGEFASAYPFETSVASLSYAPGMNQLAPLPPSRSLPVPTLVANRVEAQTHELVTPSVKQRLAPRFDARPAAHRARRQAADARSGRGAGLARQPRNRHHRASQKQQDAGEGRCDGELGLNPNHPALKSAAQRNESG